MKLIEKDDINKIEKWDGRSAVFKGDVIRTSSARKIIGYYDNNNLLHLLIESDDSEFERIVRKGMSVFHTNKKLEGLDSFEAIDFVCNIIGFDKYFIQIINEIIEKSIDENNIEKIAPRVIENWFHFLEFPHKSTLSFSELIGLVGELQSIMKFHSIGLTPSKIINSWAGPHGGKRDFIFDDIEIEVKTSSKHEGHVHKINGIDQLSHTADETILVYSWNILKDVSDKAYNINTIIESIENFIFTEPLDLFNFHRALYKVGYDKRDESEYNNYRFRTINDFICKVNQNFPRISRESFNEVLDTRIVNIDYEIDLNGYDDITLNSVFNEI